MEITTMPQMRVGGVEHRGSYAQIRRAFEALGQIAGPAGLFGREGVRMLGVYLDDPQRTPEEELRSAAALTFPDGEQMPGGLSELSIPAGRYLKLTHRGSYEGLPESWSAVMDAANADGRRRRDAPSFELYVNTPGQVANDELITEIYVPIV